MNWPNDDDGVIDEREKRVIRNEALFREVNERIEELRDEELPDSELTEFLCECGEGACVERVELTHAEYEAVRSVPDHFALKPGHEHPDFERIVENRDRYVVIDKVGQAEETAKQTDPRT